MSPKWGSVVRVTSEFDSRLAVFCVRHIWEEAATWTDIDKDVFTALSCLTRLLVCAAHNLDLARLDGGLIVELEVDILDGKGPDVVAEAVGVEVALVELLVSEGLCASSR